jgi:hypothetical protein
VGRASKEDHENCTLSAIAENATALQNAVLALSVLDQCDLVASGLDPLLSENTPSRKLDQTLLFQLKKRQKCDICATFSIVG